MKLAKNEIKLFEKARYHMEYIMLKMPALSSVTVRFQIFKTGLVLLSIYIKVYVI